MRRALLDIGTVLERLAVRDVEQRHRHVFRYEGPCDVLVGHDVYRCTRCPRIRVRLREAS
jgi:hypothetical protein